MACIFDETGRVIRRVLVVLIAGALFASACASDDASSSESVLTNDGVLVERSPLDEEGDEPQTDSADEDGPSSGEAPEADVSQRIDEPDSRLRDAIGRTNTSPSGNRIVDASVDLASEPIVIDLGFTPIWVLSIDANSAVSPVDGAPLLWVAIAEDGQSAAVRNDGGIERLSPTGPFLQPVAFAGADGGIELVALHDLTDSDLPAATVVDNGQGLRAWLDGATDRYRHGALGDDLEASKLVIERRVISDPMDDTGQPLQRSERVTITLTNTVAEGLAPLLADIDGDGADEIVITESNAEVGAQLVVYEADGSVLARSEAIGRGNRWRHQIGAGSTGPNGEFELVDVQTPHIGGIVQFHRLDGHQLVTSSRLDEFRSHRLGSTNLDMAVLLDGDGDGRTDVVVPRQNLSSLVVISHRPDGATITVEQAVAGGVSSNIAAAGGSDGAGRLAVGTGDGALLIWGAF